jgi:hypothetical protein
MTGDEECVRHRFEDCDCGDCRRRQRLRIDPLWLLALDGRPDLAGTVPVRQALGDALWEGPVPDLAEWMVANGYA